MDEISFYTDWQGVLQTRLRMWVASATFPGLSLFALEVFMNLLGI